MEDSVAETPKTPDLAQLKRMLTDALDLTSDARRDAQIDGDYYDGYQWTREERKTLSDRKQPDGVFNRVRPAVNGTLGVIKQGRTDPRAYPRNPADEDAADVASKTLRFIADHNRFDQLKERGAKDYLVYGTCAAVVEADEDNQITIQQIRWEEFIYDPRSRREDFADARYMGVAKWMYADDVLGLYPDAKAEVEATLSGGADAPAMYDATMEDRPRDGQVAWVDKRKRRLMVVELYYREDGWKRCVFHSGGVLESGDSPYVDDKGRSCNPIEAQSCYVDRENNRMGVVRDMRGPQDEINKRRSKLLHLLSVRQVQEKEYGALAGVDVELVRKEAARPDGVLPSGAMVVPTADMAAGQASLLAEAKAEIERMGPNPAMLGRQGESSSGRAQLVRQQAGLTELAVVFGGIEEWEHRLYRQMWNRARQFWTAPMFVRVTDDDGAPEFIGINQPVMQQDPFTGQPVQVGVDNVLATLDVDIVLDSVPDTANLQQEQFAMLVDLAKVGALGPNAGPLLLEASSLPNKRQVIEKLDGDEQAKAMQAMQAQMQARGAAAQISEKEASAALKGAQAQGEMVETVMKAASLMPAAGVIPGDPLLGA